MTFEPSVPRFSDRAASSASRSKACDTPKLSLVFCVPPMDWKTRSTGAPREIASICPVTWVRTQDWVGMSKRRMSSSIMRHSGRNADKPSPAGLMPITASPQP